MHVSSKDPGNVPHASPRSTNVQLLVRKVRSAGNILADRVVVLFLFFFFAGTGSLAHVTTTTITFNVPVS
ncbi:hypothetical protein BJX66DRAFT_295060 [Aspergillus keveii]|uniref:Uncharacterized protein n=1 Tax=Aspergillus keveii TaxID=714993 RepID=A0ABR4GHL0_9EURO